MKARVKRQTLCSSPCVCFALLVHGNEKQDEFMIHDVCGVCVLVLGGQYAEKQVWLMLFQLFQLAGLPVVKVGGASSGVCGARPARLHG